MYTFFKVFMIMNNYVSKEIIKPELKEMLGIGASPDWFKHSVLWQAPPPGPPPPAHVEN